MRFNYTVDPFFSVPGFWLSFAIFSLIFSKLIAQKFYYPKVSKIPIFVTEKEQTEIIENEIGKERFRKSQLLTNFIFIGGTLILTFSSYYLSDIYENYELGKNGKIIEYKISNESRSLKNYRITTVNYGKNYKQLYLGDYKLGEHRKLIYSTRNPRVAMWFDDFKLKIKK